MEKRIELIEGLNARTIDQRLRTAVRNEEISVREQAFYLDELDRSLAVQHLGFPDVKTYAIERLGMSFARVRYLLFVGRSLRSL